MYEWPTTQPKSDAAHHTSDEPIPSVIGNEYAKLTRWPPVGRWMPLGRLVVPDVYNMYSGSFASTGTQSHGSLCANNVSHETQFFSVNGDVITLVRWKITLHIGCHSDMFSASFKMSKYRMILFGSTPQLAAMTTFGSACSIRLHNSFAAKPMTII